MASMEAQMALLRTKPDSGDFGVMDSVVAALTPLDGPLSTPHSDGAIELHGILSFDAASTLAHGGKVSAAAPCAGQIAPCGRSTPLPVRLTSRYERRASYPRRRAR